MLRVTALTFLSFAIALISYDYGGEGLNIITLLLLDIGNYNTEDRTEEKSYIQLMQLSDYDHITVNQCKIEIDRTINHCEMHSVRSNASVVHNGRREYIQEIGEQTCHRLHETGTITIINAIIDRISKSTKNLRSIMLAGSSTESGRCSGSQYTDSYGSWENMVIQAFVKITLAPIKRSTDDIILSSGTHCKVTAGYCIDTERTESY